MIRICNVEILISINVRKCETNSYSLRVRSLTPLAGSEVFIVHIIQINHQNIGS